MTLAAGARLAVSPDGKRFLINDAGEAGVPRVALVTNWTAELKR